MPNCLSCEKKARYNVLGESSKYCRHHKLPGMINLDRKPCREEGCHKRPKYEFAGSKVGHYCTIHKKDGMINVEQYVCQTLLCGIGVRRANMYCERCSLHMNPEKKHRNYKTKELTVVDFVKDEFPDLTIITDKRISDGCSSRRPDVFIDLGEQIIIVEVDENKHTNYSCENKRIMELSQDVNHRSIVFIRFNPDSYTNSQGITVSSCWGLNKKDIQVVKKDAEWKERLNSLKEQIERWIKTKTEKTIEIVQLFYDQNL